MKEQELQTKIIKYLEKEGWLVIKTIMLSKAGYPDLFCFRNGETLFIEVKRPGGVRSELQKYRIKELQNQNFRAEFIESLNQLKQL